MNGAVVDLGRRYGVSCPINESLVAIIKALEARPHDRGRGPAGQPAVSFST
jgi:ketopantoate reductase